MVQVVDTKAGIGAYLGQGFASGVEKGMERQSKLQDMMQKQALKDKSKMQEALMAYQVMKNGLASTGNTGTSKGSPSPLNNVLYGATAGMPNNDGTSSGQNAGYDESEAMAREAAANVFVHGAGDMAQKERHFQTEQTRKDREDERSYHKAGFQEAEKRTAELMASAPRKQMAIEIAREAVESNKVGPISWSNLAKRTGYNELLGQEGAMLAMAAKENMLSNVGRMSSRGVNKWAEQMLMSAFAETGNPRQANEAFLAISEADKKIYDNYIKYYNQLKQNDIKMYGQGRSDIETRAWQAAEADNQQVMDDLRKENEQIQKGEVAMYDPKQKKNLWVPYRFKRKALRSGASVIESEATE